MQISTKGKNAVKMLLDLSNHNDGTPDNDGTPVRLKDIAGRQNISVKYLEQIVMLLQRASLLQSVKGNQGGYLLKYPPEQYTMFQILTATEGSLSPVECVENCASPCKNQNQCVTYRMWKKLDTAIHDTLEGITLADLMDWQEEIVIAGDYSI